MVCTSLLNACMLKLACCSLLLMPGADTILRTFRPLLGGHAAHAVELSPRQVQW